MRRFLVSFFLGTALLVTGIGSAYAQQHVAAGNETQSAVSTISYQGVLSEQGVAVPDGEYTIIVTLYHDALGTSSAWSGKYIVRTSNGVFNVLLGSGNYPLPAATQLDGALFLGVKIGEGAELPLMQLSSALSAINVADGSITAKKMGTDYIGSISINGQRFSTRGGDVNIITGDGMLATVDQATNSIVLSASGASSSLNAKGAETQNSNSSYIINQYGTNNIQTSGTFNIDGAGTIGGSAAVAISGSNADFSVGTPSHLANSTFNGNVNVKVGKTLSVGATDADGSNLYVGGTSHFGNLVTMESGLTVLHDIYSLDTFYSQNETFLNVNSGSGTLLIYGTVPSNNMYPIEKGGGDPFWNANTGILQNTSIDGYAFGITDQLAGDVNGNYYENFVNGIEGITISSTGPSNGQVLAYNASNGDLEWENTIVGGTTTTTGTGYAKGNGSTISFESAVNVASSDVTGTLPVANGGTGQSSGLAPGGVIYSQSTTAMASTGAGTSGYVLTSGGIGAPTWTSPSAIGIAGAVVTGATGDAGLPDDSSGYYYPFNQVPIGDADQPAPGILYKDAAILNQTATLSNLELVVSSAPGTGNSVTMTIWTNHGGSWAASGVSVTVSGSSQSSNIDSTNSITVSAGDQICIKISTNFDPGNSAAMGAAWAFSL